MSVRQREKDICIYEYESSRCMYSNKLPINKAMGILCNCVLCLYGIFMFFGCPSGVIVLIMTKCLF